MEWRWFEQAFPLSAEKVGGVHSTRILTSHDAVTRRAANRVRCVTIRESHSACSQCIDIRCFVKRIRIIGTDVHVPQIVDQKKYDVRPFGCDTGKRYQ